MFTSWLWTLLEVLHWPQKRRKPCLISSHLLLHRELLPPGGGDGQVNDMSCFHGFLFVLSGLKLCWQFENYGCKNWEWTCWRACFTGSGVGYYKEVWLPVKCCTVHCISWLCTLQNYFWMTLYIETIIWVMTYYFMSWFKMSYYFHVENISCWSWLFFSYHSCNWTEWITLIQFL